MRWLAAFLIPLFCPPGWARSDADPREKCAYEFPVFSEEDERRLAELGEIRSKLLQRYVENMKDVAVLEARFYNGKISQEACQEDDLQG